MFPFFFFFLFACNQRFTRFTFFSPRVPFPSIWRHLSPRPVLAPVQKFNAVKSASFCASVVRFPSLGDRRNFGRFVRNRASLIFEHALKSAYCRVLFILSPKSGPRSDFLPNVVPFGLFLLSAIAYLKIAFYLCTSNPPKGVARSFKDFPPASLRSRLSS